MQTATAIPEEAIYNARQFSELVGVSESAVSQAKASGRFSADAVTSQGFLRAPQCFIDWAANADPRGGARNKPRQPALIPAAPVSYQTQDDAADDVGDPPPEGGLQSAPAATPADHIKAPPGSLAYERTRMMEIKRRQAELELMKAEGLVVEISKFENAGFELGRVLRAGLKRLPILADDIARETDPERVRTILKEAAQKITLDFVTAFAGLAEKAKTAADDVSAEDEDSDE